MLGLAKTASAAAGSGRSRDIYRRYALALYTQALLTVDDPAPAERVVDGVAVNECALALVPERGVDEGSVLGIYPRAMTALLRAVRRRLTTS